MKSYKTYLASAAAITTAYAAPVVALAANPFRAGLEGVTAVGRTAEVGASRTLPEIIGGIINVVLGFLGIVLLGYILYAGFLWMTAGGDSDKTKEASDNIRNAIIGLVIIVSAFALSNFVLTSLINVSGN